MDMIEFFDGAFIKHALRKILKCSGKYIGKNLSLSDKRYFYKACRMGDFRKVEKILKKTLRNMRKRSDLSTNEFVIIAKALGIIMTGRLLETTNKKRKENMEMNMINVLLQNAGNSNGSSSGIIFVLIIAILAFAFLWYRNKSSDSKLRVSPIETRGNKGKQNRYTEEDAEMLELIHELAEAYRSTDRFLEG